MLKEQIFELFWSYPGAAGVIYKVGESYINTVQLSDDITTIYGIGESVATGAASALAPGYKTISTK